MPRIVDHDQRRQDLAEVAMNIVAQEGIEAMTIANVAAKSGYSTGVINHYYSNKRQMLLHTYKNTVDQARTRLEKLVSQEPPDIDACLSTFLPLNERQRREWLLWFAFWGMAITDKEFEAEQRRRLQDAQKLFQSAFSARIAAGLHPASLDCESLSIHCTSLINGIAIQAVFDKRKWPGQRQLDFIKSSLNID